MDLNGDWNKLPIKHSGRHAAEYHDWVFRNMKAIADIAAGPSEFIELFERVVKATVEQNPGIVGKKYWECRRK